MPAVLVRTDNSGSLPRYVLLSGQRESFILVPLVPFCHLLCHMQRAGSAKCEISKTASSCSFRIAHMCNVANNLRRLLVELQVDNWKASFLLVFKSAVAP